MLLYIRTLSRVDSFELEVSSESSVFEVKRRIGADIGEDPAAIRLLYAGRPMEDAKILADYNIQSGSTLYVLLR